ncbi:carbon starvation CstA family protein [Lacrimispora sp. 210928-DFI.3.58]|uniref:carbon starvation CstA family protein n=1 Tax=Lacrimispora sp. 210928-DFI.3.58 TaxID=2883214 RepID=UPI001D07B132|nr:carbon starvation CstA family protein [Lacrimispora sp. 210928-DFI.3.58]MCB7317951.1 carbon starvation protein A [Lacrimispora sp. 210928-DFI.3.58]
MFSFFGCIALLIGGFFLYGKFTSNVFGPDDRKTPAITMEDGTDYVPMGNARIFLIQLLNIAGLGPIFGALAGAAWGPSVFLWITFGTLLGGGVHDYMIGMMSMRHKGASVSELTGMYLGNGMKQVMRVFSVVLLVLVGVTFSTGPANLLAMLTPTVLDAKFWLAVVLIYYFIATFVPIDKVIGKIYPIFGICLIVMALGVGGAIVLGDYTIPEITLQNLHPAKTPIWPTMFVSVACGAISGFHATQSPLMARCMTDERKGRNIFYGAMVAEGIIALIWAAAGVAFYNGTGGLSEALKGGQANVVYEICFKTMGGVGAVIAMIGVIACPISSADTAYRSARLTLADWFKIDQKPIKNRLLLTVPLLAVGAFLTQVDVQAVWRYFSWSNQTLAMISLWAASVYLFRRRRSYWITAIPATFMSAVCSTYILMASEGFRLSAAISYPAGLVFAAACLGTFVYTCVLKKGRNAEAAAVEEAPVRGSLEKPVPVSGD